MPAPKLDELIDDPFWKWCSTQHGWGSKVIKAKDMVFDIVLSPVCATRFAMQVDPDGTLSFGSAPEDMDALAAVEWGNAHMFRDLKGKGASYVALKAPDVNGPGAEGDDPCELRLFFPVDGAKMDAFLEADPKPSRLRLRALKVRRGLPTFAKEARKELDLVLNGFDAEPVRASAGKEVAATQTGKTAKAGKGTPKPRSKGVAKGVTKATRPTTPGPSA